MSSDRYLIQTCEELRQIIPAPAPILSKRVLTYLDEHCQTLIQQATLVAIGSFGFTETMSMLVIALDSHSVKIRSKTLLDIEISPDYDGTFEGDAEGNCKEQYASLYFILPGIGFGLRVNGRLTVLASKGGYRLSLEVCSAYLQCSRAKVRAGFWQSSYPAVDKLESVNDFISQASYGLMLTQNTEGETELSPRGDPEGFVLQLEANTIVIPERPGNKVAVSLRNILDTQSIRLLFIIPGALQVLSVTGSATVSCDPQLLTAMAVNNKSAKLAIVVKLKSSQVLSAAALERSGIWNAATHLQEKSLPSFAKMMGEHMNGKGLKGKLSSALVDVVVKKDLKNLY